MKQVCVCVWCSSKNIYVYIFLQIYVYVSECISILFFWISTNICHFFFFLCLSKLTGFFFSFLQNEAESYVSGLSSFRWRRTYTDLGCNPYKYHTGLLACRTFSRALYTTSLLLLLLRLFFLILRGVYVSLFSLLLSSGGNLQNETFSTSYTHTITLF